MYKNLVDFTKKLYEYPEFLPLHEPFFDHDEKKCLEDVIDSTFVSSVGHTIKEFENEIKTFTSSKYAIATVNGTSALHACLKIAGVLTNDEVITQSLTFVATSNAITYCGAIPNFIDVDKDTMSLSPVFLEVYSPKSAAITEVPDF